MRLLRAFNDNLQGGDIVSWTAHHEEVALEQAIRHFTMSPLLTELAEETERRDLVERIPYVLHVSEEVASGNFLVYDPTEAECRHAWDAIVAEFMRRRTAGYTMHHR